jgi:hypothetical protein
MRFMMIVKANERSEAGTLPTEQELAEMGTFNEELVKAGAMIAGEGLAATSKGARVRFSGGEPEVSSGPFPGRPDDLVAGFWIIQATSLDEAIGWAKRVPFRDGQIEIRQVLELSDFPGQGEAWREREQAFREGAPPSP